MARILVIDDERSIRNTMKDILVFEKFMVDVAEDATEALHLIAENSYDLVFSDIKMPDIDGIELLEQLVSNKFESPIVMISGHGNIETAVECIKKGAYDFIEKPIDLNRLLVVVRNAVEHSSLVRVSHSLQKKLDEKYPMIGESQPIVHLRDMIERVAPTDARVLITSENGSGKEVVARQIYQKSARSTAPFIEVNCAAIPSELIESELFGHEKGAFTSAIRQRTGKFEQADGGTIFLDEIGDMSLAAQAKVLRCLQESVITPVGSDKQIKVNVRVIAATNKNLEREIAKGAFREDLFHRLNVIPLHVASLDERKDDIPLLVDHFLTTICESQGIARKTIEFDAIEALRDHTWSGNIRQLHNVIERLVILGGNSISSDDILRFA